MTKIMVVNFRGAELYGFELGGIVYVALKPIVEAMGLDWSSQLHRLKRDPILSEGMVMMTIPSGRGGPQQNVCLPINRVNGWLFRIDSNRVRQEIRERVIEYQRACCDVLYEHFVRSNMDERRQANETDSLHVRMVHEARQIFGAAAELWKQLGLPLSPSMEETGQLPLPLVYERRA